MRSESSAMWSCGRCGRRTTPMRRASETGSHREPKWSSAIENLGKNIDEAVTDTLSDKTLSDILDESENQP